MNKRRIISLFLCVVMIALSLSSCTVLSSTSREKEIVLTVGEYEVPYELYYYLSENLKADNKEISDKELEEKVFEMIGEMYAVFSLAEDYGISYDDEYISSMVDDAVSLAIEECGSKGDYKKELEESYMNDSVFRFLEKHSRTADELLSAMIGSGKYPTDDDGIIALAASDEFICVKQILVMSEDSVSRGEDMYFSTGEKHTEKEAQEIAEKAHEKAVAGEDFDTLVKEYGESLYMFNNTDGYYVCRGMWEKENENAVFALDIGEISPVVKSSSGYSVFLRCEKSDSYIKNNVDKIADDYYSAQYNILLEKRIDSLEIEKTEAYESILAEDTTD